MAHEVLEERPPRMSNDYVARLVEEQWGLAGVDVRPLSSERDLNFLVGGAHVLKVSNPAESRALVEMEVAAMRHVAVTDPDLPIPRGVPLPDGTDIATVADEDGRACLVRLITTVPGTPVEGHVVTEEVAEQVGAAAARTSRALRGFFHAAAGSRVLDWDVRTLPAVAAKAQQRGVLPAGDPLLEVVARVAPSLARCAALPGGIHHADITLTNLLVTDGTITGVIDFGDMHHTADVADLAIALTSVLRNTSETQTCTPWELAGATLRGYQRLRPLSPEEVEVLGELVLSRLVLSTIISRGRSAAHPDNTAYITQYDDANARTTEELATAHARRAGPATPPPGRDGERGPGRRAGATGGRDGRLGGAAVLRPAAPPGPRGGPVAGRRRRAAGSSTPTTTSRSSATPTRPWSTGSADSSAGSTRTPATSTRRSSSSPNGWWPRCRRGSTRSCSPPRARRPTSWPGASPPSSPADRARWSSSTPTTAPRAGWPT